ncbi:hypothetical protein CCHR01_11744 [Colletotrichum chrysophilum]|uniref:Uncharacterized protein n=1 Tax=Colletotrichum chrysophilum TaxID=1836956 RepID=A0AAD9EFE8_9PEZI|nr:hypothetical protein CCHR01_11744 [Colletotrichum chrysophilum]
MGNIRLRSRTDDELDRMAQYRTSSTAILLDWILSTSRWLIWLCFSWTTSSAFFTIFVLGLPFGRQLEGALRLVYHVIRMELGQTYATFPQGGGTVMHNRSKLPQHC